MELLSTLQAQDPGLNIGLMALLTSKYKIAAVYPDRLIPLSALDNIPVVTGGFHHQQSRKMQFFSPTPFLREECLF